MRFRRAIRALKTPGSRRDTGTRIVRSRICAADARKSFWLMRCRELRQPADGDPGPSRARRGIRDRYVMLPGELMRILRTYWQARRSTKARAVSGPRRRASLVQTSAAALRTGSRRAALSISSSDGHRTLPPHIRTNRIGWVGTGTCRISRSRSARPSHGEKQATLHPMSPPQNAQHPLAPARSAPAGRRGRRSEGCYGSCSVSRVAISLRRPTWQAFRTR